MAKQESEGNVGWEIIVVDNASSDRTAAVALEACPASVRDRLRVVEEPESGLSHARICGARAARYEIVSFIDDDNWICGSWVQTVSDIFSGNPGLGAAGGDVEAVPESTPPNWFSDIQRFYAVGAQHEARGDITDAPGTLLWGAGLSIRKDAFLGLFDQGFEFLLSDRKGGQVSSGGDTEICFALRAAGWRFWYDDRLRLSHFIPATRLTWKYARKLMRGMGAASAIFDAYLIALGRFPYSARHSHRCNWIFQYLKSAKNLLRAYLLNPSDCLSGREGAKPFSTWILRLEE